MNCDRNCADSPTGESPLKDTCSIWFDVDTLVEELFELFLIWDVTMGALLIDEVTKASCKHAEPHLLNDVLVSNSTQIEVINFDVDAPVVDLLLCQNPML